MFRYWRDKLFSFAIIYSNDYDQITDIYMIEYQGALLISIPPLRILIFGD